MMKIFIQKTEVKPNNYEYEQFNDTPSHISTKSNTHAQFDSGGEGDGKQKRSFEELIPNDTSSNVSINLKTKRNSGKQKTYDALLTSNKNDL